MRVPILMMTNAGGCFQDRCTNDRPAYSLFPGRRRRHRILVLAEAEENECP